MGGKGYAFVWMPWHLLFDRYKRFAQHIIYPLVPLKNHLPSKHIGQWLVDLLFYFLDLFFIAEVYLLLNLIFKKNIRRLNPAEKAIAHSVFNDRLLYDYIWLDDQAAFLAKRHRFAYVSFNLVNWWHTMTPAIFIHELVHIYQFQKYGFVYVYRALLAQHSAEGYDYGGAEGLQRAKDQGLTFSDFNFEQQASIIEHYYNYCKVPTSMADASIKSIYQYFQEQL